MIPDDKIDELFKDRLQDHYSPVPDDMWDRIIGNKKKDRLLWFLFFAFFVVAIFVIAIPASKGIIGPKKSITPAAVDSLNKMNRSGQIDQSTKNPFYPVFSNHQTIAKTKSTIREKTARASKMSGTRSEGKMATEADTTTDLRAQTKTGLLSNVDKSNQIDEPTTTILNDSAVKNARVTKTAEEVTDSNGHASNAKKPAPGHGRWSIDLYISPDYPIISPHENEQSKLSYSVGLKINHSFGKHLSVKTGLQFSQINIVANDSLAGTRPLHLRRFDLPLLIGYSARNNFCNITINGGVFLNLYSWPAGAPVRSYFKSNTGLSVYLGANFEKMLQTRLSVFSEPYYRWQATSMTTSSVSSMKFIDVVGINFGARYYFRK